MQAQARQHQMPGPKGLPLVGSLFDFSGDPLQGFSDLHAKYGDFIKLRLGPYDYAIVSDPEAIRSMLVQHHNKFVKSKNYIALKLLLEDGLITSEGAVWKRKRKLVQPSVHPHKLRGFFDVIANCTNEIMADWAMQYEDGARIDVHEEMMRLTFRIIGFIASGRDLAGEARAMGEAIDYLLDFSNQYTNTFLRFMPLWLPLKPFRKMRHYMNQVDEIMLPIIEERRRQRQQGEPTPDDLLSRLLDAREDDEDPLTDTELRAELMTMVAAGHETTANALTWTFYLLSQHPEVAERLQAEVDAVFAEGPLTYERLDELEYTDWVLRESMRIYPPVWVIERDNLEDIELGGYHIPKGTTIAVAPWLLHRHPKYWDAPMTFRPERFSPEQSKDRPRHIYLPFGTGPRVCVGAALAMVEAKCILASIIHRARFALTPDYKLGFDPSITLRPKHGMLMQIHKHQRS